MEFIHSLRKKKGTSLIVKKLNNLKILKQYKKSHLFEFIKDGINCNGGDYNDIVDKLITLSQFVASAKDCGIDCDLSKIDETINDFFKENKEIKYYPTNNYLHTAFYTKKDANAIYNYRGVTVMQLEETKKPIMYFGRRYEKAERHAKDTYLYFGENEIILHNEYEAMYDEIPLWGDATHAEFVFDENNKLIKISFRKYSMPRLKIWGDEKVCVFDGETNKFKILPPKMVEKLYK